MGHYVLSQRGDWDSITTGGVGKSARRDGYRAGIVTVGGRHYRLGQFESGRQPGSRADQIKPVCGQETDVKLRTIKRKEKRKVGGKRYEARSRGRSSPDTLAF